MFKNSRKENDSQATGHTQLVTIKPVMAGSSCIHSFVMCVRMCAHILVIMWEVKVVAEAKVVRTRMCFMLGDCCRAVARQAHAALNQYRKVSNSRAVAWYVHVEYMHTHTFLSCVSHKIDKTKEANKIEISHLVFSTLRNLSRNNEAELAIA